VVAVLLLVLLCMYVAFMYKQMQASKHRAAAAYPYGPNHNINLVNNAQYGGDGAGAGDGAGDAVYRPVYAEEPATTDSLTDFAYHHTNSKNIIYAVPMEEEAIAYTVPAEEGDDGNSAEEHDTHVDSAEGHGTHTGTGEKNSINRACSPGVLLDPMYSGYEAPVDADGASGLGIGVWSRHQYSDGCEAPTDANAAPICASAALSTATSWIAAKDGKMVAGGILLIPNIMYESSDVGGGGSKQGTVTAVYGHSQEGDYTHANALYDNQDAEYC
jgi:hypothetical protein